MARAPLPGSIAKRIDAFGNRSPRPHAMHVIARGERGNTLSDELVSPVLVLPDHLLRAGP